MRPDPGVKSGEIRSLLAGFALVLGCVGCGTDPCGTELLSESLSPDGQVKAVAFLRNCGATTDYVTAVSLAHPTENLTDDSRFFTPRRLGTLFRARGAQHLHLEWRSSTELVVAYPRGADVWLRQPEHGEIRITHQELPAGHTHSNMRLGAVYTENRLTAEIAMKRLILLRCSSAQPPP